MSFINPKPGGWTNGVDKITGAQIGTIATQLATAIDPVGGGVYTIGAGNIIKFVGGGGAWIYECDVTFSGTNILTLGSTTTTTISGPTTFGPLANVTLVGTLTCSGNAAFSSALSCNGAATFGSTLSCNGAATFGSTLSCNGAATFGSTLSCTGAATFAGGMTFTGTNTITGQTTTTVVLPGTTKLTGRTVDRAPIYKSDLSYTLDQNTGGNRIIMRTIPVANRIVTLRQSTTPVPENGDWFEITVCLGTSGFTVGFQREGSLDYVAVIGDGIGGTGNQVATVRVELVAGVWRLVAAGGRYAFFGGDA